MGRWWQERCGEDGVGKDGGDGDKSVMGSDGKNDVDRNRYGGRERSVRDVGSKIGSGTGRVVAGVRGRKNN